MVNGPVIIPKTFWQIYQASQKYPKFRFSPIYQISLTWIRLKNIYTPSSDSPELFPNFLTLNFLLFFLASHIATIINDNTSSNENPLMLHYMMNGCTIKLLKKVNFKIVQWFNQDNCILDISIISFIFYCSFWAWESISKVVHCFWICFM